MKKWVAGFAAVLAFSIAVPVRSQSPAERGRAPRDARRQPPRAPLPGFALIPTGSFEMGDHHNLGGTDHGNDEIPVHAVRLDSFYMGITHVTTDQYCEYLNSALAQALIRVERGLVYGAKGTDLYCETREATEYSRIGWDGKKFSVLDNRGNHPMVCVRWQGAAAYCNWLSSGKGYESCYDLSTWACDFSKRGLRLPTEAEWEYAGRGGLHSPYRIFPWGDEPDFAKANWPKSGDPYETGPQPWTTSVGFYNGELRQKKDFNWPGPQESYQTSNGANGYGLYDMAGNAWQWINDWYGRDYYRVSPADNPPGPERGTPMPDGKPYRGLRGGSWYNGEYGHSRVSNRNPSYYRGPQDPNHPYYAIGFRVVLANSAVGAWERGRPGRGPSTTGTEPAGETPALPGGGRPPVQRAAAPVLGPAGKTVGLFLNGPQAFKGYALLAPKHFTTTYLIDNEGRVINTWKSDYEPGQSAHLLPNGHMLRAGMMRVPGGPGGGEGGRIEEYDWEGNLVWEFEHATRDYQLHHDIKPLPNGNVIALMIERKSLDQAGAAGFDLRNMRDDYLLPDAVVEIQPIRPKGGRIVWEWHVWDHLVQNFDKSKANYGDPAEHPELVNPNGGGRGLRAFWNHMNSLAYNPALDQTVLSVRGNNEIWIIDHSTSKAEAGGHSGGKGGKGGDLLYRWGNPAAYNRGTSGDRQLFQQHDANWIPPGYPGAGHILIFNNGLDRGYSTIEEIEPPVDRNGRYALATGKAYGPEKPVWIYKARNPEDFYSPEISGAHRLPNGNTLICAGVTGHLFEVTPTGEKVWEYVNSVVRGGILAQGETPGLDNRGHQFNAVFKIYRYAPDYPGLAGKKLTPGGVIELPASQKGKTGLDKLNEQPRDRPGRPGDRDRRPGGERRQP